MRLILQSLNEKQVYTEEYIDVLRHKLSSEDISKLSLGEMEDVRKAMSDLHEREVYLYQLSKQQDDVSKELEQLSALKEKLVASSLEMEKSFA